MQYHSTRGGVSSIDDIKALRTMELYGAIVGKAYYIKAIDLEEAIVFNLKKFN